MDGGERKRQRYSDGGRRRREPDYAAEVFSNWRGLLLRLGERSEEYGGLVEWSHQLAACEAVFKRDLEDKDLAADILKVLVQSAEELSHKAPLYATLAGLLDAEHSAFVDQLVVLTGEQMQAALDSGEDANRLRLLLRFLAMLMATGVVAATTLVQVFDLLLAAAAAIMDEGTGNPLWQPRADFYVFCVLTTLPFCALELIEQTSREEVSRLLSSVEAYRSLRKVSSQPGFQVFLPQTEQQGQAGEAPVEEDFLEDLFVRIRALEANEWVGQAVPRPWLAFQERLRAIKAHEMSALSLPPVPPRPSPATEVACARQHFEAQQAHPVRMRRLRIFPVANTDEAMSPIDRFLVEEYLLDVLFYLNGCRRECAAYMAGLPVPFRYEFVMAETVFSQLLLLPRPPFKLIYYTVVMVDLCKALPGAFPSVVASAVKLLFERVGECDVECRWRLVQWLSHHLSNLGFVWPWDKWAAVLQRPPWDVQRYFAAEVLEKEVRLAYWDKVKESLGSDRMAALLPPRPGAALKYSKASTEAEEGAVTEEEVGFSKELVAKIRAKATWRDLLTWLQETVIPATSAPRTLDLTVQTLLHLGAKSLTHTVTALEKYGALLQKMAPSLEHQVRLVESVAEVWAASAQMAAVVVDRCMGLRIVANLAIVRWAFLPASQSLFHVSDRVWEILRNAVNKTCNRTTDLRKEVAAAELMLTSAEKDAQNAQAAADAIPSVDELMGEEDVEARSRAAARRLVESTQEAAGNARDALEAKNFLLGRALQEQEALFVELLGSFAGALRGRREAKQVEEAEEEMRRREQEAEGEGHGVGNGVHAGEYGEPEAVPTRTRHAEAEGREEDDEDETLREGGDEEGDERSSRRRQQRQEEGGGEADDVAMTDADGDTGKPRKARHVGGADGPHERLGAPTSKASASGIGKRLGRKVEGDPLDEDDAWQAATLGQLRSICRRHAAEMWPMMEHLDSHALSPVAEPLFLTAVYEGLGRPIPQLALEMQ
eukprot:TRINITY_DN36413_c0_g1_i1.p1 TRINITY_DN36413_c0_g1~~TRINITY_DN36413_c0_g1_i1.p1  ORF type:complete len:998 (+),score=280.61 TRINITY_DN36413_c0_g1_i1:180-3173(+)